MQPTECKTYLSQERIIATPEFIEASKFSLKTSAEIKDRFEECYKRDLFGFETSVYMQFMEFADVKDKLKDEYVAEVESGKQQWQSTGLQEAVQDFLDYMNFAWGKAEDERGISASRSISKLSAWLFILNREDLSSLIRSEDLYSPYGAPALIEVCNQLSITVPESLIEFAN